MSKKHAIVVIVIIFGIVFLVLPLIYITLGKLHSPVESVAKKVSAPLSGQDYVPVTANAADPSQIHTGTEVFNFPLEKKCNASGTPMISSDITAIFNIQSKKTSLASGLFRFIWNLSGEYHRANPYGTGNSSYAIAFAGGTTPEDTLTISMWAGKYIGQDCIMYWQNSFGMYNDSGRMSSDGKWNEKGLQLLEKGLTTINGYKYYWYLFEDTQLRGAEKESRSLLTEDRLSNQVFTVVYNTYNNGIKYQLTFTGDKVQNKSYRNIIKVANLYLNSLELQ